MAGFKRLSFDNGKANWENFLSEFWLAVAIEAP